MKGLDIFPVLESDTMEFKCAVSDHTKEKATQTICAFLNGKGGYIVFGVEDADRRIIGLNATTAQWDGYLRWVDNFYHNTRVVDQDGNPLQPGELSASLVHVDEKRTIMVVKVTPMPGKTYRTSDGTAWHRLSASLYKIRMPTAACWKATMESELTLARRKEQQARAEAAAATQHLQVLEKEVTALNARLRESAKEIEMLRKDAGAIIAGAKRMDSAMGTLVKSLENDILQQKSAAEMRLSSEKSLLARVFCCF